MFLLQDAHDLLIDADGKCEYTEVTMQEAVQDPVAWDSNTETFSLRCQLWS